MDKLDSPKFWRGINNARKIRYICIGVFTAIFILIMIGAFIEKQKDLGSISDLTANPAAKVDKYVSIDTASLPFIFAESDTAKLYFIWDTNEQLYIADLNESLVKKLESNSNKTKLIGTTKEITSDIKRIAINMYNQYKEADMEAMSTANFNEMVGNVYLYIREDLTNAAVYYIFAVICLTVVIIMLISHWFIERKIKRVIKRLTPEEMLLIASEIENEKTIVYEKINLFLTDNYAIFLGNSLDIIKYDDMRWIYFADFRQNGVLTSRRVEIFTKDQKNHGIPIIPYGKTKNLHLAVIDEIGSKRSNILVGYTDENKKIMKAEKKEQKNKQ